MNPFNADGKGGSRLLRPGSSLGKVGPEYRVQEYDASSKDELPEEILSKIKTCELHALKSILIREGYIRRLKQIGTSIIHGDKTYLKPEGWEILNDLLVQVGKVSLGVVENIRSWRTHCAAAAAAAPSASKAKEKKARKRPFIWNGMN